MNDLFPFCLTCIHVTLTIRSLPTNEMRMYEAVKEHVIFHLVTNPTCGSPVLFWEDIIYTDPLLLETKTLYNLQLHSHSALDCASWIISIFILFLVHLRVQFYNLKVCLHQHRFPLIFATIEKSTWARPFDVDRLVLTMTPILMTFLSEKSFGKFFYSQIWTFVTRHCFPPRNFIVSAHVFSWSEQ